MEGGFANDTLWSANCSGGVNCSHASANTSVESNKTCTNDYCATDDDYIDLIEAYIFPSVYEWILIGLHCLVFAVGLVGNFLVCLAVYRNHTMRTVTNMFIVNLAIADFLVIFLCLPPTVLWDITETWFMGNTLCKIIPYFQVNSPLPFYRNLIHYDRFRPKNVWIPFCRVNYDVLLEIATAKLARALSSVSAIQIASYGVLESDIDAIPSSSGTQSI